MIASFIPLLADTQPLGGNWVILLPLLVSSLPNRRPDTAAIELPLPFNDNRRREVSIFLPKSDKATELDLCFERKGVFDRSSGEGEQAAVERVGVNQLESLLDRVIGEQSESREGRRLHGSSEALRDQAASQFTRELRFAKDGLHGAIRP